MMDKSCNGSEEICSSLKQAKISDERKDFVSDLPDAFLVHILSFLPIKDAINTILLGDLWRSARVLDFDSCWDHYCDDPDCLPDYHNDDFEWDGAIGDGYDDLKEWENDTAVQIEKLIRYAIS